MKRTKILPKWKIKLLAIIQSNNIYKKSLFSISILLLISISFWLGSEYLTWGNYAPLAQTEKRAYVILCLFLVWVLKFLLFDLDMPNALQYKDAQIRKHLHIIPSRLQSAITFLKKTFITKHGEKINLNQLPWFLLIGPTNAGKTSLLANSKVNFILQKQFKEQNLQQLENSENCDWWITRETSIIDVPGKYLCALDQAVNGEPKPVTLPVVWRFFLRLIKKQRGKEAIRGMLIALPLPEIIKRGDPKGYQLVLRNLFQRIYEYQKIFHYSIPCYLIVTKCDLVPGFQEFFSDLGREESTQAWGITLGGHKNGIKEIDVFNERFNALIKKLNQQLLWRLHQERNPFARPLIKDFPLHIERLKEFIADFIKKFSAAHFNIAINAVYLTSSLQPVEKSDTILEKTNTTERAVQIFTEPQPNTRAYFIRQLIAHGLLSNKIERTVTPIPKWKKSIAYAMSLAVITAAIVFLGKDFKLGIDQTYSIQNYLNEYQLAISKSPNVNEHLQKATVLLDTLEESTPETTQQKFKLSALLTFYSTKSQQKSAVVYQQALKNALLPEFKSYLENYLKNTAHKTHESVYSVLRAYMMLGDGDRFQSNVILKTFQQILPVSSDTATNKHLIDHLNKAFTMGFTPLAINVDLVQNVRQYLNSLPNFQLAYVILKNFDDNNFASEINLGTNTKRKSLFISNQISNEVPKMFTAHAFSKILAQEAIRAAQEATLGNWVLGKDNATAIKNLESSTSLTEQLRIAYVNNYIDVWESLLANIQLVETNNLAQTDQLISNLISNDSSLLKLLTTLHDNTYFEPIVSSSPKLQSLGLLLDRQNQSDNLLYQIFSSLQAVHQYLFTVLHAENEHRAAFETVTKRLRNNNENNPITQLRLIADKSPEPIKTWLDKIANDAWRYLMQDATNYIDTSWQNKVARPYQIEIANRYPFSTDGKSEVELQKFANFFGNPGIIMDFYKGYLQAFIDSSEDRWRWKTVDNIKPPFTDDTLHKIQQALQIHQSFFPNDSNKPYVQFAIKPYKFSKHIQSVVLNINDKKVIDGKKNLRNTHLVPWPTTQKARIELKTVDNKSFNREFSGDWGWFRLVAQSFESAVTKKEMVLNLSASQYPVRYILFTSKDFNPFLAMNLRQFNLPEKLIAKQKN